MDDLLQSQDRLDEFMTLFARHHGPLFRYVRSLVSSVSDAEDVMQEVTHALWKDFEKFERGSNFAAWARQTAFHRVLEHRRAAGRKPQLLPDDVLAQIAEEAEATSVWTDDWHEALERCSQKLRATDQDLLKLRYHTNLQVTEIAKRIDRPVQSLYQSLSRIRQQLLACIQHQVGVD